VSVPVASDAVLKALGFLAAVAGAGEAPSRAAVDAYALMPFPQSGREKFWSGRPRESPLSAAMFQYEYSDDSTTDYLVASGLASSSPRDGVRITDIGRAFLAGAPRLANSDQKDAVLEVVGHLDDPVTNARVLIEVAKLDEPLFIDPYLPASALFDVLGHAEVRRVLAADPFSGRKIAGQTREERRRDFGIVLSAHPDAEVRLVDAEAKLLHDRLALPRTGSGLMVGASLGGAQLTVVSHLSETTTDLLRAHYEEVWSGADPIAAVDPPSSPGA
jgi:hypothetical protein